MHFKYFKGKNNYYYNYKAISINQLKSFISCVAPS